MNKGKVTVFKLKNLALLDRLNLFLSELDIGNFSIKDLTGEYHITFSDYQNFYITYNIDKDILIIRNTIFNFSEIYPNKFLNWIKIYFEKDNEKKSINPKSLFLFPYQKTSGFTGIRGFVFESEKDGYLYFGGHRGYRDTEVFNIKLQDLAGPATTKEAEIYELTILPKGVQNINSNNGFFINKCFYAIGKITKGLQSTSVILSEGYSKTDDIFYQLVTGIDHIPPYFIKIKDNYFCVIDYGLFLVIIDSKINIIEEIEDGRIKTEHYKTLQ